MKGEKSRRERWEWERRKKSNGKEKLGKEGSGTVVNRGK